MKINKKILLIGGDMRSYYLYKNLDRDGYIINAIGFDKLDKVNFFDKELIKMSNIIIAPTPFCKDDYLVMPYSNYKLSYTELLDNLTSNQVVFAGAIFDHFFKLAEEKNINVIDILNFDELAILNAIPTSEGAIAYAINNSEITLHNSNILITGFGRIGKNLAKILKGFDANIFIGTTNESENAYGISNGHKVININKIEFIFSKLNFIFNTIPYQYIDSNKLTYLNNECLLIDLASKPYGIDHEKAKVLYKNSVILPGLPGKTAPKTTAIYMENLITKIINEMVEFQ